MILEKK